VFLVLGMLVIARIWWAQRHGRRRGAEQVIHAEYSVETVEAEPPQATPLLPRAARSRLNRHHHE
jgi:hypothetical protein